MDQTPQKCLIFGQLKMNERECNMEWTHRVHVIFLRSPVRYFVRFKWYLSAMWPIRFNTNWKWVNVFSMGTKFCEHTHISAQHIQHTSGHWARSYWNWIPFCHTIGIGLPHRQQPNASLMLSIWIFSATQPPLPPASLRSHSLWISFSIDSESGTSIDWYRNNWYAKIILWILFGCDVFGVWHFISQALKSRQPCNGQMLFGAIYLILCCCEFTVQCVPRL